MLHLHPRMSAAPGASIEPDDRNQINTDLAPDVQVIQQLRPPDGGLAAWRLLIVAFVFEVLLRGKRQLYPPFATIRSNNVYRPLTDVPPRLRDLLRRLPKQLLYIARVHRR